MTALKFDAIYYDFLDELQASSKTNMLGAAPYLRKAFHGMKPQEAVSILSDWMRTYSERHPQKVEA